MAIVLPWSIWASTSNCFLSLILWKRVSSSTIRKKNNPIRISVKVVSGDYADWKHPLDLISRYGPVFFRHRHWRICITSSASADNKDFFLAKASTNDIKGDILVFCFGFFGCEWIFLMITHGSILCNMCLHTKAFHEISKHDDVVLSASRALPR